MRERQANKTKQNKTTKKQNKTKQKRKTNKKAKQKNNTIQKNQSRIKYSTSCLVNLPHLSPIRSLSLSNWSVLSVLGQLSDTKKTKHQNEKLTDVILKNNNNNNNNNNNTHSITTNRVYTIFLFLFLFFVTSSV